MISRFSDIKIAPIRDFKGLKPLGILAAYEISSSFYIYNMRLLCYIISLLISTTLWAQPDYSVSIGLSYSDMYIGEEVDQEIFREVSDAFEEQLSIRAGVNISGDINNLLAYRSGIIYRGSGTSGFDMQLVEMPILLLVKIGAAKVGGGVSPSIMLNSPSFETTQFFYPVHFTASFDLLDRVTLAVGHLRQLNSIIRANLK